MGARLGVPAFDGQYHTGQPVTLMIRPEMAEIEDLDERRHAAGDDSPAPGTVQGTVLRAAYLGSVIEYDVAVAGQTLALVEHDPRRAAVHPEGGQVRVRFLEDCLYVMRED